MSTNRLKGELKRLANLEVVDQLTKQVGVYEKRVKTLLKDFDVRSRDARTRSRKQLDRFTAQVKETRANLEKRVREVVTHESERLNQGLTDLFKYIKDVSQSEKLNPVWTTLSAKKEGPKAKRPASRSRTSSSRRSSRSSGRSGSSANA